MPVKPDFQEDWNRAVEAVGREYSSLPGYYLDRISVIVSEMKSLKTLLFEATGSDGGEAVCEACSGACCDSGKYHFTITDLLVYLSDGKELFTPDFSNGRCPYLGPAGCLMEPQYRPFNCITFNCERLEKLLPKMVIWKFYEVEKELRARYASMEKLFGNNFMYGLASNYERRFASAGRILFNGKQNK